MTRRSLGCAVAAPLVFASSLLASACSSNEPASPPVDEDAGASSGGGSSSSSSGGPTASDHQVHGMQDGGCMLESFGPRSGRTVRSVRRVEGGASQIPWQDATNALQEDGVFAKTVLDSAAESEEIQITGFGFKLPPGNVFQGVAVQLKRRAPDGGIVDGAIGLIGVPNQIGRTKFIATPWPSSIVGTHHYGQATDTWGYDLNAPDVEREDFGVALWVKKAEGATTPTALVESIRVAVFYCR